MGPFAETLGQVLSSFIDMAARDEAQSSPNYIYILFETTALTLRHLRGHPQLFATVENCLGNALNFIMQQNVTDMIGYAFQIYSLFVANSTQMQPNYRVLSDSILSNRSNWDKDMRYLVPALANFLIAMIYKYPETFLGNNGEGLKNLQEIVAHLMHHEVRMEVTAMNIASAIFEKLQAGSEQFVNGFLMSVFTCLHFYRNNTKTKLIPLTISKAIWSCLATFIIYQGSQNLIAACDKIQPGILFMILKSEGDKIRQVQGPPARERKYAIVAYSQIITDAIQAIPDDVLQVIAKALVELCASQQQGAGGFQLASTVATDTEDLLVDGAIDQTFAFQRSQYIQLNAGKIELSDKLEQEVPSAEVFCLQSLQNAAQVRTGGNMQLLVGNDQKCSSLLMQLTQFYGGNQ